MSWYGQKSLIWCIYPCSVNTTLVSFSLSIKEEVNKRLLLASTKAKRKTQLREGIGGGSIKFNQKQTGIQSHWGSVRKLVEIIHPMEKTAVYLSANGPTGADGSTGWAMERQETVEGKGAGWWRAMLGVKWGEPLSLVSYTTGRKCCHGKGMGSEFSNPF